ncbi:hypothetical protein AVEN_220329-1, partial [Araneus ventricosus]
LEENLWQTSNVESPPSLAKRVCLKFAVTNSATPPLQCKLAHFKPMFVLLNAGSDNFERIDNFYSFIEEPAASFETAESSSAAFEIERVFTTSSEVEGSMLCNNCASL